MSASVKAGKAPPSGRPILECSAGSPPTTRAAEHARLLLRGSASRPWRPESEHARRTKRPPPGEGEAVVVGGEPAYPKCYFY